MEYKFISVGAVILGFTAYCNSLVNMFDISKERSCRSLAKKHLRILSIIIIHYYNPKYIYHDKKTIG